MTDLRDSSRKLKLLPTLAERGAKLASGAEQLAMLDELTSTPGADFESHLERAGLAPLRATGVDIFQINVGRVCNQTCGHCHVDAGPTRTEVMSRETA